VYKLWRKWGYGIFDACHKPISQKSANALVRTDFLSVARRLAAVRPLNAALKRAAPANRYNTAHDMLKKRLRLRAGEVEEVLKKGRSVRSAHMQLKLLPNLEPLRSAAVVAKSVARKANVRNSLRRAIYRAIASVKTPLPRGKGVFFLRVIPVDTPGKVIKEEVSSLLSHNQ
jgi:RNase P protein component